MASSSKKMASFISRLRNLKKSGGFMASRFSDAKSANCYKKKKKTHTTNKNDKVWVSFFNLRFATQKKKSTEFCYPLCVHLNTLSIALLSPHVLQNGVHGPSVIKLLFKLVWITWRYICKEHISNYKWQGTCKPLLMWKIGDSLTLTSKLNVYKHSNESLG